MQAFHIIGAAPLYTNTFLLISDAGHAVVIDPAADAAEYDRILKENHASLSLILCTHGHYDHVGSAQELRARWGARLLCEPSDVRGDRMYPLAASDGGYPEDGELTLDELTFRVWHTPGHTPGCVCLLCGDFFFTGDTLFQGSMGRTDLPGGDPAQMRQSLRKLASLPVPEQAQVLPGHGDFSQYGWEMKNNYYVADACRRG